jgi:hypothetical protein
MSEYKSYIWPNLTGGPVVTDKQGIDYLIVYPDQFTMGVYFILPVQADMADKSIFRIDGGERIKIIDIIKVEIQNTLSLKITVDSLGDWSPYRLSISESAWEKYGIDPVFSGVSFSFKINCPNEMDCQDHLPGSEKYPAIKNFDYQAKDYESFKQAMLDRIPLTLPDWWDRAEADFGMALVDLFAYAGDRLSYFQDRVAAESQFQTSRNRQSVAGHLKLIDYQLDPGQTAKTHIYFEVDRDTIIPGGTVVETPALSYETPVSFTLRESFAAYKNLNEMKIYDFSHPSLVIPAGTLQVAVCGTTKGLEKGSKIIIEKNNQAPASPKIGDAVHLVELNSDPRYIKAPDGSDITVLSWNDSYALPWDAPIAGSRILGNIALLLHGLANKVPPVYVDGVDNGTACYTDGKITEINLPAGPLGYANGLPLINLTINGEAWRCVSSLKESQPYDMHYQVVDLDNEKNKIIFGDNVNGFNPEKYSLIEIDFHVGLGSIGNVSAGALTRLHQDQGAPVSESGITYVNNPFPGKGGRNPETEDHAKQWGPKKIREQQRAVTTDDYAREAMSVPGISRAMARFVWTGSWFTVRITLDPQGTDVLDDELKADVYAHLMSRKLAGYDIQIFPARYVPLDIKLNFRLNNLSFRDQVYRDLTSSLGNGKNADGTIGFFNPDNWTFGQSVKLSSLYSAIAAVPGIECANVIKFKRLRKAQGNELTEGAIPMHWDEIALLDNDRSFPEHGRLDLELTGGR